ncbi:MAG: tRNA uridine-5-carboxymethylaminomethyl(34) synthesis enzyme MnmG [Clostridia bacterium]|nr:tRNA uridine-5-carboxymethylaminomethyl(34) synthesis enzyme MnmG [Clostridia bacterium]MBQ6937707.1 tRNA uridine-5-carboxymethylaminomethyl(34) synthesis enzyme MnmG [Clostridia bacterium]MBR2884579.1 tRNA uridine-5-carboxymethylaminomethyl(34) synthesis enzyme MnmG [Clostridia bacterium]
MDNTFNYDIAVIGAGHAGCEAALAAARLGMRTILLTINLDSIANMPCNPSIGGTAKGHLVREIDALGGEMGKVADLTKLQTRMLNLRKGPAVHSLRAQADRRAYQIEMKKRLEEQENLYIRQAEVKEIQKDDDIFTLTIHTGTKFYSKCVIISTGTYLESKIIIGESAYSGGPDGLFPSNGLSESLQKLGVQMMRFKTGTPTRVHARSVDFSVLEKQEGDKEIVPFSFETTDEGENKVCCYLTYTNTKTHDIIRENLHRSPLFNGLIDGIGPRYCPSIEDKVVRFADRERHQIFIEPMGLSTQEMYLQGMSTSLPEDVQLSMLKTMKGLENVEIMRSAYAIEYDCCDPLQLKPSLEMREIPGLFGAGQFNGTSGYEEAAAQGLMAGINAARKLKGLPSIVFDRSEAYIGVLIDDLVTKGTNEPYRMLTSRAEYRLLLRQDNADLRLTPTGYEIGLISEERYKKFLEKKDNIEKEIERINSVNIPPTKEINEYLEKNGSQLLTTGIRLAELIRRPELCYEDLAPFDKERPQLEKTHWQQAEIAVKYEGYIKRQFDQVERFAKNEKKMIPQDIDYSKVYGLRTEARQKLEKMRPENIGRASRISGVSPADIGVLLIYLATNKDEKRE